MAEAEDASVEAAHTKATLEVLRAVWTIAKRHQVCASCLMFNAASQVRLALDDGDIDHGPPDIDEEFEIVGEFRTDH
jgi:hypothetical protein